MTLARGTKLGPYEVESLLGAGGMGEVWKAKDTRVDRMVALKVLPEEFFEDAERRERFSREAKMLASLNHPGIAVLYSFEEFHGANASSSRHLLVMELVEGEDLGQRLLSGPLGLEESLSIARQIAEALEAAHEMGIVHRDLKPANVKVTRDGRAKLLDFGLAKIFEPDPAGSSPSVTQSPTLSARATEAGVVLGTAAYMSPEQARGKAVDKRSDIWAFGVVLYEMLTGRRLFEGETVSDVLASVLKNEPDLARLPAATPPGVLALLRSALRKDPKLRLRDIGDARIFLDGAVPEAVPAPPGSGGRGLLFALAATAALAVAAVVVLLLRKPPETSPAPGVRFRIAPSAEGPFNGMVALSPDGSRLAAVVTGADGRDRVFLRALDALDPRPVPGTEGAAYPFFAPDGKRLGFFANGSLRSVDLESGNVRTICKAKNPRGGTWGADDTILFAPRVGGAIDRVPAAGGEPSPLVGLSAEAASVRWPTFLPDGRHFLFFSFGEGNKAFLKAGALGSAATVTVAPADSGAFFSNGFLYFLREGRLVRARYDSVGSKLTGPATVIAEDVFWDIFASGYAGFTVSRNGTVAWLAGGLGLSRLVWHDRSGKELGPVGPPGAYFEPDLSPDGKTLAVSRSDPASGSSGIWLLDLLRGSFVPFSLQPAAVTPLWRADGKRVAYSTFPHGAVFSRDAGASGKAESLVENGTFCILEDWVADGRLFFTSVDDLSAWHTRILVRPAGGGAPEAVLSGPFSVGEARLSPDGRWLAYVSDESGIDEVMIRSYPEGAERFAISAGGGSQPRWRGDGRELFYVTPDAKMMSVPIETSPRFDPGTPRTLFQSRILPLVEARNHFAVTPDGQRFLVNCRQEESRTLPIVVATTGTEGDRR